MNNNNDISLSVKENDPFGKSNGKPATMSIPEDSSIVEESTKTAQNDTTAFVDDGMVVRRDESHVMHIDNTILSISDTNVTEQSIKTFLARPILFQQGSFSITDTYSLLDSYSMPYAALTSSQAVMWREKLAGIFGIRMDMRFRLVVNANRFQQGRYIMGWVALAGAKRTTSSLKELSFVQSHMATIVQRTTVPHVEVDLATDTTAELLVPYVSCRNYYPLTAVLASLNEFPLGYLNIYPYSPMLSPAGSTTAGYSLYVSFENVRLFGAASAQSGLGRRKDIQSREVSNSANGPISSVSLAISKGFKEFANIPVLSSYANSISWVADRVTNVASVFGWSKPMQGDSLTKMQLNVAANHNTIDGDSDARPLSYLSKPGVVALDGSSGTDLDEMDFSYVARKSAWFSTIIWSNSSVAATDLATLAVWPYTEYTVGSAVHFQPIAFVSSFFRCWRGSIRFRFKFVKTEFHSGRLSFSFFPGDVNGSYSGNAAYVHRVIVDIRDKNEIDLVIPYIRDSVWTTTNTGNVVITVVDPLIHPATVSSSITILCEIAAGEDFEVSIPKHLVGPYTPVIFTPQSGIENDNRLIEMDIGNSTIASDPNISSAIAIGDKVSSFRALLKRYTPARRNNVTALAMNGGVLQIRPDVIFSQGNLTDTNYVASDHYSIIASCYAVVRGGVRIRDVLNRNMFGPTTNWGPSMAKVCSTTQTSTGSDNLCMWVYSGAFTPSPGTHVHIQDLNLNSVVSVEVPQYTFTMSKSAVDITCYQGSSYGYTYGPNTSGNQLVVNVAPPQSHVATVTSRAGQEIHNIYRSLADDGNFGCFISVPAMRVSPAETDPIFPLY